MDGYIDIYLDLTFGRVDNQEWESLVECMSNGVHIIRYTYACEYRYTDIRVQNASYCISM